MTKGLHKNSLRKVDNPHQWMIDDARQKVIQQIRAEVERLKKENANIRCEANEKYCLGYEDALNDLLSDLQEQPVCHYGDTPSEERCRYCSASCDARVTEQPVCEDVEKELERFLVENVDVCVDDDTDKVRIFDVDTGKGDIDITYTDLKAIARHFYELSRQGKPEMSEELETEVERCVYKPFFDLDGVAVKGATHYLTVEDVADIARHFAQWQKEQMMKEGLNAVKSCQFDKIERTIAGVFVKYGMDMQKQDMMEEAVEGEVTWDENGYNVIYPKKIQKEGKVKLLIVKEE